jgi:glyoxylate/hydroxypyruvate reductase A
MRPVVPYLRRRDLAPHDDLLARVRAALPGVDVPTADELADHDVADVRVAVVDGPDPADLALLSRLEWVQSTWAGVDAVLETLPEDVSVARLVDPQLGATMAEAVAAWVLYLHRDMPAYAAQQRDRVWRELPPVKASDRRVGLLGLGEMGRPAAATLVALGFDVAAWTRRPRTVDGITTFHGDAGLTELLERSDIVVDLLPLTPATTGLLDETRLARLPAGARLINFGRGATLVDDHLLAALDAGHLGHAVLDVFTVEPLPADHPYWTHESVTVLPHISAPTSFDTAAVVVSGNVRRYLDTGELPTDALVDRARGY